MTLDIEHDPGLERTRRDHRSERAPLRLRARVLERLEAADAAASGALPSAPSGASGWSRRRALGSSLAAAVLLGAVWLRLPASQPASSSPPAPEPSAGSYRPSAEPAPLPLSAKPAPARPCPIEELLGGLAPDALADTPRPPPDAERVGLSWQTLRLPTRRCGPLPRHFLQLVPPGMAPVYRGPVLILLPGSGSPESLAIETRWYFEGLAREKRVVAVYAKAMLEPRPSAPSVMVGGWQTDPGVNPEVDDEEYLDRIVLDLTRRGLIGGGNDIWLVGKGNGAVMALSAAAHHPERYTGVAAFGPTRLDAFPPSGLAGSRMGRRLTRILFVVDGGPENAFGGELEARSKRWAIALGAPEQQGPGAPRVVSSPRGPGVRQIDIGSAASGAPGVRILTFERGTDPFPPPGGADAVSLAASRQQPNAMNGAEEAWRYLGGD